MFIRASLTAFLVMAPLLSSAEAQTAPARTEAPKGAAVYFHSPLNGSTVPSTFKVLIGLRGLGVAPAGVTKVNTGHHHLLVDVPIPPADEPIPNDPQHIHLGGGQTEVEVTLPPGRHTLQLLVADHDHMQFQPTIASQKITILVSGDAPQGQ